MKTDIRYNGQKEDVIWKSDISELSAGAKIYSRINCEVLILKDGVLIETLDDSKESYQISEEKKKGFFSRLFKSGNDTTENCEIYYINKSLRLENKWGTPIRIDIYDKEYDIFTNVGSSGSYRFFINDAMKLFSKIQGSIDSLSQENLKEFFRSELNMEIRNTISNFFNDNKLGIKELALVTTLERSVAKTLEERLSETFDFYGVTLERFIVNQINFEDDFIQKINDIKKESMIDQVKENIKDSKKLKDAEIDTKIRTMTFESQKSERDESREDFKIVTEAIEKLNKAEPKVDINVNNNYANEKKCANCNTINTATNNFCSNCGEKL